MTIFCSTT